MVSMSGFKVALRFEMAITISIHLYDFLKVLRSVYSLHLRLHTGKLEVHDQCPRYPWLSSLISIILISLQYQLRMKVLHNDIKKFSCFRKYKPTCCLPCSF